MIVGVLLVAGSSLVTALVLRPPSPPELARPGSETSVSVDHAEYWDERTVTLKADWERAVEVRSPREGMVTADSCYAGRPLRGGESLLALGGVDVVMVDTTVPLWRDLQVGEVGPDVDAVEEWAVRRGDLTNASGVLSEVVVDAFNATTTTTSITRDGARVLSAEGAMWVPPGEPVVADCTAAVGQLVGSGEVVAELAPALRSLEIVADEAGSTDGESGEAGERVLVVDVVEVELPENGIVTGADLDALALAPSLGSQSMEGGPPVGTTRLRDPIAAYVVPPAAITVDSDGATCVHSDGEPRLVEIVGSELGRTYVTSPGELVRVDVVRVEGASCG